MLNIIEVQDQVFLEEKFPFWVHEPRIRDQINVRMFVWQTDDNKIGFGKEVKAYQLLKSILAIGRTFSWHVNEEITPENISESNIYKLMDSITITNPDPVFEKLIQQVEEAKLIRMKNAIRKRHNREELVYDSPRILNWRIENKFTQDFFDFAQKNEVVIWGSYDGFLMFYQLSSFKPIVSKIENICVRLGISVLHRTDLIFD